MSYYGNDGDTTETEASFTDPSAELEVQTEADDPNGDLGDGMRRRKHEAEAGDWNIERTRSLRGW